MTEDDLGDVVLILTDPEVEDDLVAQLLYDARADVIIDVAAQIEPSDFYYLHCRTGFAFMVEQALSGEEVSAITLVEHFSEQGFDTGPVIDWMAKTNRVGSVQRLVVRVADLSRRRKLHAIGLDVASGAMSGTVDDVGLVEEGIRQLGELTTVEGDSFGSISDASLHERDIGVAPWLIDGLLYPMDRLMFVAEEGSGKSLLARQVNLCAQAGINPFTRQRNRLENGPVRTLLFDFENRPRAVTRSVDLCMEAIRAHVPGFIPTGHTVEAPDGINLLSTGVRRRFEATVRQHAPQLIFVGPLYKTFVAAERSDNEQVAASIANFFDRICRKYGTALWIEHHAPFGGGSKARDLRPFGSSYWLRWPEYGRNFTHDPVDEGSLLVGRFRNDRSVVYWPEKLHRGIGGFPFTGEYRRQDIALNGKPVVVGTPAGKVDRAF